MQFSDSIEENMELVQQLIGNLTAGQKERAKRNAERIVGVIDAIRKDNAKDGAAGIGVAFAVFYVAQNLTKGGTVREDGPRIQLLS